MAKNSSIKSTENETLITSITSTFQLILELYHVSKNLMHINCLIPREWRFSIEVVALDAKNSQSFLEQVIFYGNLSKLSGLADTTPFYLWECFPLLPPFNSCCVDFSLWEAMIRCIVVKNTFTFVTYLHLHSFHHLLSTSCYWRSDKREMRPERKKHRWLFNYV